MLSISCNHSYALFFLLFIIFNTFIIFKIEHNLIETYIPFIPLYKQKGPSGLYLSLFLQRYIITILKGNASKKSKKQFPVK